MFAFQQTLPGLAVMATETRRAVGAIGEEMAARAFEAAGYGVVRCRNRSCRGDLLVIDQDTGEIFRVEVKTSRLGKDKHFRFTLYKRGCTDYHDAQFVLLVALSPTGYPRFFLIPVKDIPDRKSIKFWGLVELLGGKWARYRIEGEIHLEVN